MNLFGVADYVALGVVIDGCYDDVNTVLAATYNILFQLVNNTSSYNKLDTVVLVILLGTVEEKLADKTVQMIAERFLDFVAVGYIQVIQESAHSNSNVAKSCPAHNQSSHIVAMTLVQHYVTEIADNYVHVGYTDVDIAPHFIDRIREFCQHMTQKRRRGSSWTILDFGSSAGYDLSGVFMRAVDVTRFASFFSDFFSNNVSLLHGNFLDIVSQRSRISCHPALFRRYDDDHVGADLAKPWPDSEDPIASVFSSMHSVGRHSVEMAYASGGDYFKASGPVAGDWITIVFDSDVYISKIKIQTGLHSEYPLLGGTVEASPRLLKLDASIPSVLCADFVRVGEMGDDEGTSEFNHIQLKLWGRSTRCLRITVTNGDGNDVVFHQIAVYS